MTNEATAHTSRIGARVKTITGYSALARFNAALSDDFIGQIPRESQIPSPYTYSPIHVVSTWLSMDMPVIIVETKHRRYEVFEVTGQIDPLES